MIAIRENHLIRHRLRRSPLYKQTNYRLTTVVIGSNYCAYMLLVMLLSLMLCMVFSQCTPMVRLLNTNHALLWACLIIVQILFEMATTCCFACSSLLVNNSVTQDLAGQANGLGVMITAIGRTFTPVSAGALFSWVVTYGPEIGLPFDTSFPFFVIGATYTFTIFLCLYMSPRLNKQKK